jgi:hypothetical protein
MGQHRTLCQLHPQGASMFGNRLDAGGYFAAVACDLLPQPMTREEHVIRRGYAVGFGQWFFFTAKEPAVAFGRAARMSLDCRGYGVYEAAHEVLYCRLHHGDERVLLVSIAVEVRGSDDEEVEALKRFVQGVKEHPWSAHWHAPTGYITAYNDGKPIKTSRRSLPL